MRWIYALVFVGTILICMALTRFYKAYRKAKAEEDRFQKLEPLPKLLWQLEHRCPIGKHWWIRPTTGLQSFHTPLFCLGCGRKAYMKKGYDVDGPITLEDGHQQPEIVAMARTEILGISVHDGVLVQQVAPGVTLLQNSEVLKG